MASLLPTTALLLVAVSLVSGQYTHCSPGQIQTSYYRYQYQAACVSQYGYDPCNSGFNTGTLCPPGQRCLPTAGTAAGWSCIVDTTLGAYGGGGGNMYGGSSTVYGNTGAWGQSGYQSLYTNPCAAVSCATGTYCVPTPTGFFCSSTPQGVNYGPGISMVAPQSLSGGIMPAYQPAGFVPAMSGLMGIPASNVLWLGAYGGSAVVKFRFVTFEDVPGHHPANQTNETATQMTDRFVVTLRDMQNKFGNGHNSDLRPDARNFFETYGEIQVYIAQDDKSFMTSSTPSEEHTYLRLLILTVVCAVVMVILIAVICGVFVLCQRRRKAQIEKEGSYTTIPQRGNLYDQSCALKMERQSRSQSRSRHHPENDLQASLVLHCSPPPKTLDRPEQTPL